MTAVARLRSWFLRNLLEAADRELGSSALATLAERAPARVRPHLSLDRLRTTAALDAIPLDEGEDALLALDQSLGDGTGRLLERLAREMFARQLVQAAAAVRVGDLYGTVARLRELVRTRTAAHSAEPLRRALALQLGDRRIEDLPVPFQCCAARIEDAAEHWFDRGPIVDAVLASAAVPGLLPAVRVGESHYLDGGLVDSIPLGRAVELGARRVFVLQVGRIEQALAPPRNPWEVGAVAFEIARRHRFARDLATAPDDVEVHVLPAGEGAAPRWNSREALRYRDFAAADRRIEGAYAAAAAYLEKVVACH